MLGIFKQALAQAPQELHCPNNPNPPPLNNSSKVVNHGNKAKLLPTEILQHFQSCHGGNAFSVRFDDNGALIAFAPQERSLTATQRYVVQSTTTPLIYTLSAYLKWSVLTMTRTGCFVDWVTYTVSSVGV